MDPQSDPSASSASENPGPGPGGDASDGFEVVACDASFRGDQAALFEACFGQRGARDVLDWRYDRCPHGQPIALLGRVEGRAVSGYACNPRRIGWDAASVTVGQTGDVMSHPDARGKGYFTRLDRAAMQASAEAGWPVVFGLPNRQSANLFLQKLGWMGVGNLKPWTFVLRASAGARRERLRAGRLASALVPLDAWRGRRVCARLKASSAPLRTQPVERFGTWVEPLGRALSERYEWVLRRDADYLNWRFFEGPHGGFEAVRVDDSQGRAVGYAVTQTPSAPDGLGFLVDLVGLDESAERAALLAALERLRGHGAAVVRAHAVVGSTWQRFLQEHAFVAPKQADQKWVIAYPHQPDHPLAQAALDPSQWFFTDADRDDELVR